MESEGFYVAVALEVVEDHPVADVVYRGTQVAAVRADDGTFPVTLYAADGVPLDGLVAALTHVRHQLERLGSR
jgi:hypothetical protein